MKSFISRLFSWKQASSDSTNPKEPIFQITLNNFSFPNSQMKNQYYLTTQAYRFSSMGTQTDFELSTHSTHGVNTNPIDFDIDEFNVEKPKETEVEPNKSNVDQSFSYYTFLDFFKNTGTQHNNQIVKYGFQSQDKSANKFKLSFNLGPNNNRSAFSRVDNSRKSRLSSKASQQATKSKITSSDYGEYSYESNQASFSESNQSDQIYSENEYNQSDSSNPQASNSTEGSKEYSSDHQSDASDIPQYSTESERDYNEDNEEEEEFISEDEAVDENNDNDYYDESNNEMPQHAEEIKELNHKDLSENDTQENISSPTIINQNEQNTISSSNDNTNSEHMHEEEEDGEEECNEEEDGEEENSEESHAEEEQSEENNELAENQMNQLDNQSQPDDSSLIKDAEPVIIADDKNEEDLKQAIDEINSQKVANELANKESNDEQSLDMPNEEENPQINSERELSDHEKLTDELDNQQENLSLPIQEPFHQSETEDHQLDHQQEIPLNHIQVQSTHNHQQEEDYSASAENKLEETQQTNRTNEIGLQSNDHQSDEEQNTSQEYNDQLVHHSPKENDEPLIYHHEPEEEPDHQFQSESEEEVHHQFRSEPHHESEEEVDQQTQSNELNYKSAFQQSVKIDDNNTNRSKNESFGTFSPLHIDDKQEVTPFLNFRSQTIESPYQFNFIAPQPINQPAIINPSPNINVFSSQPIANFVTSTVPHSVHINREEDSYSNFVVDHEPPHITAHLEDSAPNVEELKMDPNINTNHSFSEQNEADYDHEDLEEEESAHDNEYSQHNEYSPLPEEEEDYGHDYDELDADREAPYPGSSDNEEESNNNDYSHSDHSEETHTNDFDYLHINEESNNDQYDAANDESDQYTIQAPPTWNDGQNSYYDDQSDMNDDGDHYPPHFSDTEDPMY